jgi:hypothetical protein
MNVVEISKQDLADLLREAQQAHHEYEKTAPPHDWADWYAEFIIDGLKVYGMKIVAV